MTESTWFNLATDSKHWWKEHLRVQNSMNAKKRKKS